MEFVKELLKNKKVIGFLLMLLLSGIGVATGVPKELLKDSICEAPAVVAPAIEQPVPEVLPAKK